MRRDARSWETSCLFGTGALGVDDLSEYLYVAERFVDAGCRDTLRRYGVAMTDEG